MEKLFGTDGVRGRAGRWPLTADFVRRLGWAAGRALSARYPGRARRVLIVRDTRASGPALQKALMEGLGAAGYGALDGGVLPTASVAALAPGLKVAAGAVLSASHNPAEFNGIKLFSPAGAKLPSSLEADIETLAASPEKMPAVRRRWAPYPRAGKDYLAFLLRTLPKGFSLKGVTLVIDAANGAAHRMAPLLFRRLGARVIALNVFPNGKNINRRCGALHPAALARAVRRHGAHLGVAFDGDADRAIFVDEKGHVKDGDAVLLAAARYWRGKDRLAKNTVVITVMANLGTVNALSSLGIRTHATAVGDKHVWQGMARTGAVLGGEPSGHVIFRDYLSTGDGLLTALQVLRIVTETGRPLSALTSLAAHYPQILVNVPVRKKPPLEKIPGCAAALKRAEKELGAAGRVLVRYSGTEPLLRVMVEGPDGPRVRSLAEDIAGAVRRSIGGSAS